MTEGNDIRNKILNGDISLKITSGFMVIGQNTADHTLSTWHSDNEEYAVNLATSACEQTGGCYEIIKYELLGVIRPKPKTTPVEYIKMKNDEK